MCAILQLVRPTITSTAHLKHLQFCSDAAQAYVSLAAQRSGLSTPVQGDQLSQYCTAPQSIAAIYLPGQQLHA